MPGSPSSLGIHVGRLPDCASSPVAVVRTPSAPSSPVFEPLLLSDEEDELQPLSACGCAVEPRAHECRAPGCAFVVMSDGSFSSSLEMSASGGQGAHLRSRGRAPGPKPWLPGTFLGGPPDAAGSQAQDSTDGKQRQGLPGAAATSPVKSKREPEGGQRPRRVDTYGSRPEDAPKRLFLFCLSGAWLAAFCFFFIANAAHTVEMRAGEQHLLTANSLFATEVRVSPVVVPLPLPANASGAATGGSAAARFNFESKLFIFNTFPRQGPAKRFTRAYEGLIVASMQDWTLPLWLNRGSMVQVSYRLNALSLKFVVIKGKADLVTWRQRPVGTQLIGSASTLFLAHNEDLYIFALANRHPKAVACDLSLEVVSAQYDVSESSELCDLPDDSSESCVIRLPFGPPKFAIISTTDRQTEEEVSRKVQVSYTPRVLAYVVLLLWPFAMGILALLLYAMNQAQGGGPFIAANVVSSGSQVAAHAPWQAEGRDSGVPSQKHNLDLQLGQEHRSGESVPLMEASTKHVMR